MFRRHWDPHARALEINNLIVRDPAYDDLPELVIDPGLFVLNPLVRQSPFFIYDELHWSSLPQAPDQILRSTSVNSRPSAHFTLWPLLHVRNPKTSTRAGPSPPFPGLRSLVPARDPRGVLCFVPGDLVA